MNRTFVFFVAALMTASLAITSAQQSAGHAEKLLASAQHKATIDGDLKGAIEEYKRAIAAAGNNRAVAAQALLRMAECHQKLGDAEAQAIYQRLVREYPDQKDTVDLARSRLTSSGPATRVKSDWSVWAGRDADGFGTISPDGRFLTYTDWRNDAGLVLRDLTTGTNHRLTTGGFTQFSTISKDGRWVAYEWTEDARTPADRRHELRVAKLHANSISEPRRLFYNDEIRVSPYDWSPDGKWVAISAFRKDGTNQIALVGVQDGALRVLKSLEWKAPTKIFFSPDGRHIAYDLPVSDSSEDRHVFVMAVDGSQEAPVVADPSQNVIMGWSPDGTQVLFSSNRSGTFGLWAVPVENGRQAGLQTLLKADISSSWSLGLTSAGTMYVWKYASPVYVQTSSVDLTAGKLVSAPPSFHRFISSRGRPDWSADGKHLAYQSCNPLGGGPCTLWVHSMETGELRELKPKLGYFGVSQWSPDGRELLTTGSDLRKRNNGLYRIDVQTGEAKLVASPFPSAVQWAADGKHVYYRRGASLIERNLASGVERETVRIPDSSPGSSRVSPDGRSVAYISGAPSASQALSVMPLEGGAPRVLMRVSAPERLNFGLNWTANGAALAVARQVDDNGRYELWLVPVNDDKPRKLDIDVDHWHVVEGFRFDRAGKQIAFVAAAGQPGLEIRALENFLPANAPAGRGGKK